MSHPSSQRQPKSVSNNRKQGGATERIQLVSDRDGEKLSPVDFNIRDAVSIQLPPLQWVHYNVTPSCITVRNTGFTLMINAAFNQQAPYVCSGPLTEDYVFAQIHFHWGEHDSTGSGHAIDGIRYPLEMHVVHLKRDCANLGEAFSKKDGIAVMVHMFALREERNTHLDQLTAILQFIHKPKCCARLYPTPLAEIVQPFSSDYFLYWGAVGSPRGQYRILWFLSRNVLPVSAQQLGEFRQLCNSQGKALVSNTNKPYPLAERSLFLVSPSDRMNETMCGVSQKQNKMSIDSDDSIDLRNAEYKSLADLDEVYDDTDDMDEKCNKNQCRICPVPKRLHQTTNIDVGYPFKVNEGDTSVEESCIDLGSNSAVTVKTETKYKENIRGQRVITNVNVTTFRPQKYRIDPYDAVYSVVSSRGSELHLRRKPVIVRPSDPSREQACMMLSQRSSTYQTFSAPSLTGTGGHLTSKKLKSTDVSHRPIKHMSSELAVFYRDSETWEYRDESNKTFNNRSPNSHNNNKCYKDDNLEERTRKTNKRVVAQEPDFPESIAQRVQISKFETNRNPVDTITKKQAPMSNEQEFNKSDYYIEEVEDTSYAEQNKKYLYFKRNEENRTFSNDEKPSPVNNKPNSHVKVSGKFNTANHTTHDKTQYIDKHTRKDFLNCKNDINETDIHKDEINSKDPSDKYTSGNRNDKNELFQSFSEEEIFTSSKDNEKYIKKVIFKEEHDTAMPTMQNSLEESKENNSRVQKLYTRKNEKDNQESKTDKKSDAQYKVRLLVRTTISDHRKPGQNGKKFYVTKISPLQTTSYITPKSSRANIEQFFGNENGTGEYYYAKPLNGEEQTPPEIDDNSSNQGLDNRDSSEDVSFSVKEYHGKSSKEFNNTELLRENKYVVKSNIPKENIDQEPNPPQKIISINNVPPHTVPIFVNENEDDTYEYEEEYMENQIKEFNNETVYKRTTVKYPHYPHAGNRPPEEQALPRQIAEVKPKNNGNINENCNSQIQFKENVKSVNNLVEQTNTYQHQDDPDKRIVDKIVTGKVGETKSTDVFIKSRTIEITKPEKTDVSEEVNYSLVKSKHPKPQQYNKEPLTKSQPRAIITQMLSLDQKTTGHSRVRQTVEYHNERGRNKTTDHTIAAPELKQETARPSKEFDQTSCTTEVSEEERLEQFVTVKKSQPFINNKLQPSIQQESKKQLTDTIKESAVVKKDLTTSDNKEINKSIDHSTVIAENYTETKSSTVITSQQHTRTGYISNKLPVQNKNIGVEVIAHEPVNDEDTVSYIKPQTAVDTLQNRELKLPDHNVSVKPEVSSTQHNLTRLKENSSFENVSYEHEETSAVNKHFKYRNKLEKTIINRGNGTEHSANNSTINKQQITHSEKSMESKVSKEDLRNDKEIPSTSKYQQSRDKEPSQSIDSLQKYENENIYEEETEESVSGYKSQKTRKTITVLKKGDPSYKIHKQTSRVAFTPDTNHIIPVKKIEIPEPHYITRIPKQPLVEYEAYPVDPQRPFEIITETKEEISSTVKTNKTFMMFKRINGKAILNQPSVIEPMKMERNHKLKHQQSALTNSDIVSKDQIGVKKSSEVSEHRGEKTIEKLLEKGVNSTSMSRAKQVNKPGSRDYEGDLDEYELSETSLLSKKQSVYKEKRQRLTVRQPSGNNEDINEHISCPTKPTLISTELTSMNNINTVNPRLDMEIPLTVTDPSKTDSRSNKQNLDLDKSILDRGTKIPQVSVTDNPISAVNHDVIRTVNERSDASCKVPAQTEPATPKQRSYTGEQFYESITKEETYESSKKRYVSTRGHTRIVNTRPYEIEGRSLKPPFIRTDGKYLKYSEDEPTRDLPMQEVKSNFREEIRLGRINESSSESYEDKKTKYPASNNQIASKNMTTTNEQRSPTSSEQHTVVSSVPGSKTDGDIVIFIRQPRSKKEQVTPKITVDVTEKQFMTSSELDAQKIQVHEIKDNTKRNHGVPRDLIVPRKSKSAGNYPSFSSSDSNEEQVIDTTHYNLTLKSETQVELEKGKSGRVKSKNEVTITPLIGRPGTPALTGTRRTAEDHESDSCDEDGDSSDSTTSFEEPLASSIAGLNQSPIRINSQSAQTTNYPKLQFFKHWNCSGDALLENNGKTLRGSYIQETSIPYIRGGPLSDDYVFSEVHFHWGHKDCCGAEHIIDGKRYTIEAHFLYFKKEYGLLKEAMAHDDGLSIVAVNLTVGGPPNPQLGELLKDIRLLREPNTGAYVPARSLFSWAKSVIETSPGYYSYKGSLTIDPPQVEAVTWMVFPEPIIFCCQQSQEFRKLKSSKGAFLTKNFRAPQPLNNRTVYYVPL